MSPTQAAWSTAPSAGGLEITAPWGQSLSTPLPPRIVAFMNERPEVVGHYESIREEDRISSGFRRLELLRVQEVLTRHLPPAPVRVLDVGGGTGIHASWLAERGDSVHVVDLIPRHVEKVRSELAAFGVTAEEGDARSLNVDSGSFDVVLVFGPMYHLTTVQDRREALHEAVRAVRPGGLIAVAAINRFASLFDGLARGYLFDTDFRKIVEQDLADGQHRNPDNRPHWFTTAYLHEPEQLRGELVGVGLDVVELVGLEGLAGWLSNLADDWETESGRETILYAARTIESTPSLLGLSAHLLAIAAAPC